jgi:hypothetical protein
MKKIIATITLSAFLFTANACEICGCGLGNYYIGILPQFSHRFVGIRYQFHQFKTRLTNDPTQFSNDFYQTYELWTGWNFGKKWRLMAFLPFNINHQTSDEGATNKSGLGDIALLANYNVFDKTDKKGSTRIIQQLWLGGGVKLPTGKFEVDPMDADLAAMANTQIGSGSTDVMFNGMYNLHINKIGISTTASYKINTSNKDEYRFGNKFSANSFVSYSASVPRANLVITPNAGLLYEHSSVNKLNNAKVNLTGGNLLMAAVGAEFGFNKITVGFNAQLPVAQNFAENQTKSRVKGMLHLTFAF